MDLVQVLAVMGIDEGIIVVKQITDEWKWFQAMQEIQTTFKKDKLFRVLPYFNSERFEFERMMKFYLTKIKIFAKMV